MEIELKGFHRCSIHPGENSLLRFIDVSKAEMFLVQREGNHLNVSEVMETNTDTARSKKTKLPSKSGEK